MSIFIATEAFDGELLAPMKLAELATSALSAAIGVAVRWRAGGTPKVTRVDPGGATRPRPA